MDLRNIGFFIDNLSKSFDHRLTQALAEILPGVLPHLYEDLQNFLTPYDLHYFLLTAVNVLHHAFWLPSNYSGLFNRQTVLAPYSNYSTAVTTKITYSKFRLLRLNRKSEKI